MPKPVRGPAVELTVKVRYPMPRVTPAELDDLGAASVGDLIRGEVAEMQADPGFLADLLESDRSEVTYSFELDDPDDPFGGGDFGPRVETPSPWAGGM